jgi:flavin reductase (DIM6/NTAB) family NADH-FMN oxidoreductase RutF
LRLGGAFQQLVTRLDYPLFVATVATDHERDGCLVGFATQCSVDPPRFLACISNKNRTFRLAERAETMAIHFLPDDARDLAELFGGETGDEVDKLAQVEW